MSPSVRTLGDIGYTVERVGPADGEVTLRIFLIDPSPVDRDPSRRLEDREHHQCFEILGPVAVNFYVLWLSFNRQELLDAPEFVRISSRDVRVLKRFVCEKMAKCLPIILICVILCIVLPKPFAIASLNGAWLYGSRFSVRSVTNVLIHKAQQLTATNAFKSTT